MTEIELVFGINKDEELHGEILTFLGENAADFGEMKSDDIYIFFGGKRCLAFEEYRLFFAFINIDDSDDLEKLLRPHHQNYCFIRISAG